MNNISSTSLCVTSITFKLDPTNFDDDTILLKRIYPDDLHVTVSRIGNFSDLFTDPEAFFGLIDPSLNNINFKVTKIKFTGTFKHEEHCSAIPKLINEFILKKGMKPTFVFLKCQTDTKTWIALKDLVNKYELKFIRAIKKDQDFLKHKV